MDKAFGVEPFTELGENPEIDICTNCDGSGEQQVSIKRPCSMCEGTGKRIWVDNICNRRRQDFLEGERLYSEKKWFDYYYHILDIISKEFLQMGIQLRFDISKIEADYGQTYTFDKKFGRI